MSRPMIPRTHLVVTERRPSFDPGPVVVVNQAHFLGESDPFTVRQRAGVHQDDGSGRYWRNAHPVAVHTGEDGVLRAEVLVYADTIACENDCPFTIAGTPVLVEADNTDRVAFAYAGEDERGPMILVSLLPTSVTIGHE